MDEHVENTIEIGININWNPEARRYVWTYDGPDVDPVTGNFTIRTQGRTAIIYKLDDGCTDTYELLYVNLDPETCATYQIEDIHIHHKQNTLTIIDRNDYGNTGTTPFCLRLVARMTDNIASGFLSSDPQVTNGPNSGGPP
jgi:hypothetical protein